MKHNSLQTRNSCGSIAVVETTVRHQLFSSLLGRIKVGLLLLTLFIMHAPAWGQTYSASWDGALITFPNAGDIVTTDGISFVSNFNPTYAWVPDGQSTYEFYSNINNHIDLTTNNATKDLNLTHIDVSAYHNTPSVANTFLIKFSASSEFDENDLVGTPVELSEASNPITPPEYAASARLYRTSTDWGPWLKAVSVIAQPAPEPTETYTATFNTQGGSPVASITESAPGAGITLPEAPTKTGYVFTGWYTAATGGNLVGFHDKKYRIRKNITLYAHWAEFAKSANFIKIAQSIGYRVNDDQRVRDTLAKYNYSVSNGADITFDYDADGVATWAGFGIETGGTLSFWVKPNNQVSIKTGDLSGGDATLQLYDESGTQIGSNISIYANTTKSGLTTSGITEFRLTTPSDWSRIHNISITDLSPKTVSFNTQGGTPETIAPITEASFGAGITLPTAPTKSGYIFGGWYTAATGGSLAGNAGATYKPTDNITLYAHWAQFAKSVDFMAIVKKTTTIEDGARIADTLSSYHYTISETTGLKFDNQDNDDGGFGIEANSRTLSFWVPAGTKVTIKVGKLNGASSGKTATVAQYSTSGAQIATGTISANESKEFTTSQITEFRFTTSSGGWSRIQKIDITPLSYSITGATESDSKGTVAATGTVTGLNGTTTLVPNGDKVYLGTDGSSNCFTATPEDGYVFDKWKIGDTELSSSTNVTSATTITAYFKTQTFDVTIVPNDDNYGSVNKAKVEAVPYNSTISASSNVLTVNGTEVTATPATQTDQYTYAFSNWSGIPSDGKVTGATTVTANFTQTPRTYTIQYTLDGGAWVDGYTAPTTYTFGTAPTLPTADNITKAGYTFNGWDKPITAETTGDQTLTAQWTANQYTVTLDQQGGTGGSSSVTATYGAAMPSATMPTRTGYTFGGYYDQENGAGTQYYDASGASVRNWDKTAAAILYAKWTAKTTNITLDANTEHHGNTGSSVTATYGQTLPTFTACTPADGYTLAGYFTTATDGTKVINADGTLVASTDYADADSKWKKEDASLTLYAQYTAIDYTVTCNPAEHGSVSASKPSAHIGDEITLTPAPETGYQLATLTAKDASEQTITITDNKFTMPASNVTVAATFAARTDIAYAVKHYQQNITDDQYTLFETENLTGTTGASVTPAVKSYTGFTAPSTQTVTIAADGSTVVTYNYTRNSYTLTWELDGGTITEDGTPAGSVKFGASLTAPTVEKEHYTFKSWSPAVLATMPASAATYTAQWATIPVTGITLNKSELSLTVDGTETLVATIVPDNATDKAVIWSSGNETVATVNQNGEVTAVGKGTVMITATSHADGSLKANCNITVTAAPVATYTVTYAAGDGTGTAPTQESVAAGTKITLAANTFTAPAGKVFDGWLCDINSTKYNAGAQYTMTAANTTFTAQWTCYVPIFKTNLSTKEVEYTQNATATALTVAATENCTLSYQWQSCADKFSWSDISDATNASYTPSTATLGTTYYRCIMTNTVSGCNASATSNAAMITIIEAEAHDYAKSVDFMAAAHANPQPGISDFLTANNYTIDALGGVSWDTNNYGYVDCGLKVDNQERILSFWVKADQYVVIQFGTLGGNKSTGGNAYLSYDGGVTWTQITGGTESGGPATYTYTTEADTEIKYKTIAQDGFWSVIQKINITAIPYTISFSANGGTETMDDMKVAEGYEYIMPACSFTAPSGKIFDGWKLQGGDDKIYDTGKHMTMGGSDITYVAQWTNKPTNYVPRVTNLEIIDPEGKVVPLHWSIPGICDLSNPVAPNAQSAGVYNYMYDSENDFATAIGSSSQWGQYGVAFEIPPTTNIQTITVSYLGNVIAQTVDLWFGVCDANNAYWEASGYNAPDTTDKYFHPSIDTWATATTTPIRVYWHEGDPFESPVKARISQVAAYANSRSGDLTNQSFSVKEVRYHVKDQVNIKEVVIVRKKDSAPTSLTDGVEIYRGIRSQYTDNSLSVSGTYYYTAFAIDSADHVSQPCPPAIYVYEAGEVIKFIHDGNWNVASNWSNNEVPTDPATDVIIAANCTIPNNLKVDINSIEIDSGSLHISPKAVMQVNGTITRTGGLPTRTTDLYIHSSAEGNGALIFDNKDGNSQATVEMYSKAYIQSDEVWNWQYVGTPFNDVTNVLNNYRDKYLYKWDNATRGWTSLASGDAMDPFLGHCFTQDASGTITMTGTLCATTDKLLTVVNGYSVYANSWTAPIQIDQFTEDDFFGITDKTVYLFNTGFDPEGDGDVSTEETSAAGTYLAIPIKVAPYIQPTIPSMQGFYVSSTSPSGITLKYDQLCRTDEAQDITINPMRAPARRAAATENNEPVVLKMRVSGSRFYNKLYLFQREDFSNNFDSGWDGEFWDGESYTPCLYANTEAGEQSVASLPQLDGTVIGFAAGEDNAYTFTFEYDNSEPLYLFDSETNIYTPITNNSSYTFTTTDKSRHNRFLITTFAVQDTPTGNSQISAHNDSAKKIILDEKFYIINQHRLFDGQGKLVK